MNYQSLQEALATSALSLGYTPTHRSSLHKTLCESGFPIASIDSPVLLHTEGERERENLFSVRVNFMCANELSDEARAAVISRMAAEVEQFVSLLRGANDVLSVEVQESLVQQQSLTIAGEVALTLKAILRCIDCNH